MHDLRGSITTRRTRLSLFVTLYTAPWARHIWRIRCGGGAVVVQIGPLDIGAIAAPRQALMECV